jgi:ankyrin repeat protein
MSVAKRARGEEDGENNEDHDEQAELDNVLLAACLEGSIDDVKAALTGGGSNFAANEEERTGLSFACEREDWEVALPIVKLLLAKRFAPSMPDQDGWNALHFAARFSCSEVVSLLLQKMRKLVINITNDRDSALSLCCHRDDEEAVEVARVLLDAGADVESGEAEYFQILLVACQNSRPELVSLLLERGANVKVAESDGWTALQWACVNGAFGREIIPLLVNAGVDVLHKADNGVDAMTRALCQSGAMAETLSKFLLVNYKSDARYVSDTDPISSMVVLAKFGKTATSRAVSFHISKNLESEGCWAELRNGVPLLFDESEHDVFNALSRSKSVNL